MPITLFEKDSDPIKPSWMGWFLVYFVVMPCQVPFVCLGFVSALIWNAFRYGWKMP